LINSFSIIFFSSDFGKAPCVILGFPSFGTNNKEGTLFILKTEEENRISGLKCTRAFKSRVLCIETNIIYKNQREAAVIVYGNKKFTRWISQSHEKNKTYLGYTWKYLDYLID
jgi:hypothetical protein